MSASSKKSSGSPRVPHSAYGDLSRLNDAALLAHLQYVLAIARARGLDADLRDILGEELLDMRIETEARRFAAGEPSMFFELPSVRAAAGELPS